MAVRALSGRALSEALARARRVPRGTPPRWWSRTRSTPPSAWLPQPHDREPRSRAGSRRRWPPAPRRRQLAGSRRSARCGPGRRRSETAHLPWGRRPALPARRRCVRASPSRAASSRGKFLLGRCPSGLPRRRRSRGRHDRYAGFEASLADHPYPGRVPRPDGGPQRFATQVVTQSLPTILGRSMPMAVAARRIVVNTSAIP